MEYISKIDKLTIEITDKLVNILKERNFDWTEDALEEVLGGQTEKVAQEIQKDFDNSNFDALFIDTDFQDFLPSLYYLTRRGETKECYLLYTKNGSLIVYDYDINAKFIIDIRDLDGVYYRAYLLDLLIEILN